MSNRKQRDKNKLTARLLKESLGLNLFICRNCGIGDSHYVPPVFGQLGFYSCEKHPKEGYAGNYYDL
jgi:hypothetical protein